MHPLILKLIGPAITLIALAWTGAVHIAMLGDQVADLERMVYEIQDRLDASSCYKD